MKTEEIEHFLTKLRMKLGYSKEDKRTELADGIYKLIKTLDSKYKRLREIKK